MKDFKIRKRGAGGGVPLEFAAKVGMKPVTLEGVSFLDCRRTELPIHPFGFSLI